MNYKVNGTNYIVYIRNMKRWPFQDGADVDICTEYQPNAASSLL